MVVGERVTNATRLRMTMMLAIAMPAMSVFCRRVIGKSVAQVRA